MLFFKNVTKKFITCSFFAFIMAMVISLSSVLPVFASAYFESGKSIIVRANSETVESTEPEDDLTAWNLSALNSEYAHSSGYTGEGVKICIVDSGIDIYSEVYACGGVDLEDPEYCNGDDLTGHGSAVAGIIAAPDDGSGTVGIAPDAQIYNVRVLDGANQAPVSRIIDALDWCIANNMDIVNMSFGTDEYSPALKAKIEDVSAHGIIMISSAGNGETVQYPAAFPEVISVSSVNSSMQKPEGTATGDFSAPGINIYSTSLLGGYCAVSGSSIAAAHITGCAAVLLGIDTSKSAEFIKDLLIYSCKGLGNSNDYGCGIPDLEFAVDNYNTFSADYSENNDYVSANTSATDDYSDEDVFVEGQWSKDGHEGLASYTNLSDLQLIKQVSWQCDYPDYLKDNPKNVGLSNPHYFIYKGSPSYHGVGNYIATVRFLYTLARHYKYGISYDANSFIPLMGLSKTTTGQINMNRILNTDIPAMFTKYNAETNEKKSTVVMGMLFHLLGDIYAHRSIVPCSSIDYDNRTAYGNGELGNEGKYFVVSDFVDDCSNHVIPESYYTVEETEERTVTSEDIFSAFLDVMRADGKEDVSQKIIYLVKLFVYFVIKETITITRTVLKKTNAEQRNADYSLLETAKNIPQNEDTNHLCCGDKGCYGALKRLAGLGVLQFKDIKYFLVEGKTSDAQKYYEDQAPGNEFYKRRYLVAGEVITSVFGDLLNNSKFNPANLLPIYTPHLNQYYLKLDQLYNYLKITNETLDDSTNEILKSSYWSNRTDSLFNYTTIIYNGDYFIDPSTYEVGNKPKYYSTIFPYSSGKTANSFYLN